MKILWVTNILFPEAQAIIQGVENTTLKGGGGWMLGAAEALLEQPGVGLIVATVNHSARKLEVIHGKEITYYLIPYGKGNLKYNSDYENYWRQINDEVKPDIIHIHGTEFSHGLAFVNSCGSNNVVVSIQGLKSVYYYYYYYGLTKYHIYKNLTIHDIFKGTIISGKNKFRKSGELEKELLRKVGHIIGRTSWDRALTWAINPDAQYHFCNETLRSEFYSGPTWEYEKCIKHTIFLSQAGYPIKGLHMVIRAMPLILRHYPDAKIRIAGDDITRPEDIWGLKHFTGYGKIIKKMISKYKLNGKVIFTGNLNAEDMKKEYLRSNIFLCPSSIENSPNSLGEAQILGVPCVASYVGGIPDMMKGNEDNLYRFEEVAMLADKVCKIFYAEKEQVNMSTIATTRHNPVINSVTLLKIYNKILSLPEKVGS